MATASLMDIIKAVNDTMGKIDVDNSFTEEQVDYFLQILKTGLILRRKTLKQQTDYLRTLDVSSLISYILTIQQQLQDKGCAEGEFIAEQQKTTEHKETQEQDKSSAVMVQQFSEETIKDEEEQNEDEYIEENEDKNIKSKNICFSTFDGVKDFFEKGEMRKKTQKKYDEYSEQIKKYGLHPYNNIQLTLYKDTLLPPLDKFIQ